jgi:hypothetical protein
MARACAERIRRYLKLPVTLITDSDISDSVFDQIINVTNTQSQQRRIGNTEVVETWKNFGRHRAYELSPYDETILLDADYMCGSDQLLKLFDFDQPFMCHRNRIYIGPNSTTNYVEQFGNNVDMYWATVVYFNRSAESESIFEMMKMIQDNYEHYAKIYRFRVAPYRNDYAISIAINTVYGHIKNSTVDIPWPLYNVEFTTDVEIIDDRSWELRFEKHVDGKFKKFKITTYDQDLHILNKDALFRVIT